MTPKLYVGPEGRSTALAQAALALGGPPAAHPDGLLLLAEMADVGIDQVRDFILWARYGPVRAPHKVAVVGPAERMTREAANALLKILEETPSYLEVILFADALYRVLPTVRSRCALLWSSPSLEQTQVALREMGYRDVEIALILDLVVDHGEEVGTFLAQRRDPLREWTEEEAHARRLTLLEVAKSFTAYTADPIRRRAYGRRLASALLPRATDEVLAVVEVLAKEGRETVAAFLGELARFLVHEAPATWPELPEDVRLAWARKASLARGELDNNANPRLLAEVVALWPRRS